jgi:hypothetical protein
MALPDLNLGGVSPAGAVYSYGGPFRSGGSVYHVHGSSGANIDVYRSTNPGTDAWSLLDSAGNTANDKDYYYAWQDGTDIKIITSNTSDAIEYHEFSMSAETWTTVDESVDNVTRVVAPSTACAVMNLRSDGDRLVMSHGDTDKSHGAEYHRVDIARWEGSTWSIGIDVSGSIGDQFHHRGTTAVMTANDRFHCIWYEESGGNTHNSVYLSGNTFGVQADVVDTTAWIGFPLGKAVAYDNGGTEEVRVLLDATIGAQVLEFDDADNPTYILNDDAQLDGFFTRGHMAVSGTQKFVAGRSNNDIYISKTGTNDDNYGTEEAIATVDTYNYLLGMNVYDNDAAETVVGLVFAKNNNATPVDYDEYVISGGAAPAIFLTMPPHNPPRR